VIAAIHAGPGAAKVGSAPARQHGTRGTAQAKDEVGTDRIGADVPADAVGAEILAFAHGLIVPSRYGKNTPARSLRPIFPKF